MSSDLGKTKLHTRQRHRTLYYRGRITWSVHLRIWPEVVSMMRWFRQKIIIVKKWLRPSFRKVTWRCNHCFVQVERRVPGKLAVRCSTRASWLTGLWPAFIAEMAKHKISPSGMNCDWLIGDIVIGDTSPTGGGTDTGVTPWMNSRRNVWSYDVMVKQEQFACRLLRPSSLCFLSLSFLLFLVG